MNKNRAKFYLSRLKSSSVPELIYRVRQVILACHWEVLLKKAKSLIQVPFISPEDIMNLQCPSFRQQMDEAHFGEILGGKTFSLHEDKTLVQEYEQKFRSLFLPRTSRHGSASDPAPDIRAVWEPARLQHITLLIASLLHESKPLSKPLSKPSSKPPSKSPSEPSSVPPSEPSPDSDEGAVRRFTKSALLEWIKANPFPLGLHYLSAMECGLRVPVFFYCLKFLDDLSDDEYRLITEAIYLHAFWISKRLSLYSSLGNHTIAECLGLVFAGVIFGKTKEGNQWLETGFHLLNKESKHQILNDGGPAEQSFSYHRFVLDLYWLAVDFLMKNTACDCSQMKERLALGEDFLAAFTACCDRVPSPGSIPSSGSIPSIGDSDDGFALAPGVFPARSGTTGKSQRWYETFPDSGYTIVRTRGKALFTFDHGPLGMSPLFNHGHADALSITLSKEGQKILADPGTCQYNGPRELRRYFKGTRAHSTVTVDGEDQAVQETSFIWSKPYEARLSECAELKKGGLLLRASHTGYARLKEPVMHHRAVLFFDQDNFIIKDTFQGKGRHTFELNYHLHPQAVAKKEDDGWWHIGTASQSVFIKLMGDGRNTGDSEDNFLFVYGQENPLLGWYSPCYGIREKSGVLHCSKKGFPDEITFMTAIGTQSPVKESTLKGVISQT
ncbi:MAG: alginate lyase family protein [bacterium]